MKFAAYVPGLLFCLCLSLLGLALAQFLPQLGHISLSLMLGIAFANFFPLKESFRVGIGFSEKRLLEFSIALLGLNLSYHDISFLSGGTILALVAMVALIILSSLFLGKLLGLSKSLSFLIGVGNAVCGSAAILATSRVLDLPKKNIVISIALVQFLGIIALFLLPFLFQNYDKNFSSFMIGGSLQAMGHVVAASSLLDAQSANVTIAVKMIRILLLTPLVIGLSLYVSAKRKKTDQAFSLKGILPLYIVVFVFCFFLTNFFALPTELLSFTKAASHFLFSLAMVALGSGIKISELSRGFGKASLFSAALFVLQVLYLMWVY